MICNPAACGWAMLKVDLREFRTVEKALTAHWNNYEKASSIDISFLEETVAALYETDRVLLKIILFFTMMGLIGLTGFTIEQKTKEIGVRRLVGADG
jgi:putative ABC transport system permease protein